jgi:UDP-3-O-[3-hydroxymyristoyl] glucosamine N-acyltransferase
MQRFPKLFIELIGLTSLQVHSVTSPELAKAGSIIFITNPKSLSIGLAGLANEASVLVISHRVKDEALKHFQPSDGKAILIATNVELAMASVVSAYFLRTPYANSTTTGIHPTAIIHPTAHLSPDVKVGSHVFIGANVQIGSRSIIGANSVIEDQTCIGEESVIHPLVYIGHSTLIGNFCEVMPQTVIGKEGFGYAHDEKGNHYRIPHQGRVVLEDNVHIGSGCSIDRATFGETYLEAGAKLDNQVHIAHNCRIGRNALLTAGFMMAGSSKIGANFVAGGNTVVTGHIEICDNVQVAGVSAVNKSIDQPGQYGGNPILPLQEYIKMKVFLTKLPEMAKQLKALVKQMTPPKE